MSHRTAVASDTLPSGAGRWCREAPKGGKKNHRRWLIDVMLFKPYDTESQSRNADFMFIARKGDTATLGPKGRQTYEPSGQGPVNPKNLSH